MEQPALSKVKILWRAKHTHTIACDLLYVTYYACSKDTNDLWHKIAHMLKQKENIIISDDLNYY